MLLAALTVLLAGGCAANGTVGPSTSQSQIAPGSDPVASWRLTGGYTLAGVLTLRPPRLVVYPDGQTIADAAYRTDLSADEVSQLVDDLVADLRGTAVSRRASTGSTIVDAPTTVLTVRSPSGTFSASAEGLDELRESGGYSDQLYAARDRLDALHRRIVVAGQPYTSERVRVVVDRASQDGASADHGAGAPIGGASSTGATPPWPVELKLPEKPGQGDALVADLDGQSARDAVRLLNRDLDLNGAWQTYKTVDGSLVRASWRYLLPDE
jgi:hypothetical protein